MATKSAKAVEAVVEDSEIESRATDVIPMVKGLSVSKRQEMLTSDVTNLAALRDMFGTRERDWDEIEPGFDIVAKAALEDVPLVIAAFRFNPSKKYMERAVKGDPDSPLIPATFVSCMAATYDPETEELTSPWFVFNDGSTGIKDQLTRYASRYDNEPAFCPPITTKRGLRKSEYEYDDGEKIQQATTWYIG